MLLEHLLPRFDPPPGLRPRVRPGAPEAFRFRWLGAAGFAVETPTTSLLIDPYVSRLGLASVALGPLVSDVEEVRRRLPARVDAVLLGHAHFDHLLDAPLIAQLTGAALVGSRTVCSFGRAALLPDDKLVEIPPSGARHTVGDVELRFVPSLHGRVLGRTPHPGHVWTTPRLPARWFEYKAGDVFGVLVRAGGVTLYHNGSANLIDEELAGERADVLLLTLALRGETPRYVERLVGALQPRVIVPTHFDAFFLPVDRGVRLLPHMDFDGFIAEVRKAAPAATIIVPGFDETVVVPADDPAGAGLA